jgi:hypothetical protein
VFPMMWFYREILIVMRREISALCCKSGVKLLQVELDDREKGGIIQVRVCLSFKYESLCRMRALSRPCGVDDSALRRLRGLLLKEVNIRR